MSAMLWLILAFPYIAALVILGLATLGHATVVWVGITVAILSIAGAPSAPAPDVRAA